MSTLMDALKASIACSTMLRDGQYNYGGSLGSSELGPTGAPS